MKKLLTLTLIALSSYGANAQLQNGGMETWHTYTSDTANLEEPDFWYGSDSLAYAVASTYFLAPTKQVFQDAHAHSGSSAAMLISRDIGGLVGVAPAVLGNGQISVDLQNTTFAYTGGTPVTQRITFVTAWIDYQPQGVDEGLIQVQAVLAGQGQGGADSVVGMGELITDGTSGYEALGVAVTYVDANVVPDKILISFWSSADIGTGVDGSTMYVDDVTMSTLSLNNTPVRSSTVKCYPNPANDVLHLRSVTTEPLTLNLYGITGQLVHCQEFTKNGEADLSRLNSGMYFYTVTSASGETLMQEKLLINK